MKQARVARGIALSTTLAIDEKVRMLEKQGQKVWSFGAGQPDAGTPPEVAEAGVRAIREGHTRYTSSAGTPALRETISRKLERENGLVYSAEEIMVSAGAKQAIYIALAVLLDPGDEVLIPAPYWVSYPPQVTLLGGQPKIVSTDVSSGFKLTPDVLRDAIGPRTCCLLLNSPANPTGAVYTRDEISALARVLLEKGLYLVTDEIYEHIVYEGTRHASPVAVCPELRERTAVVNGVSKSFSMTGWRIGYLAAPREWVAKATAIQSHLSGNPSSISQEAARAALSGSSTFPAEMVATFARRRSRLLELLSEAPELQVCPPMGAFYVFPDFSAYFGRGVGGSTIETDTDLAAYLIDEARVALVPGSGFGSDRHLRISFAVSDEEIEEGMRAMLRALERLR
jgi:aspartate aminotransferase